MELHFKFSMERATLILKYLGKGPFEEVAETIADMQAQAQPQLNPPAPPPTHLPPCPEPVSGTA